MTASIPAPLTQKQKQRLLMLFLGVFAIASLVAGGHSYAIDNEIQFQTTRSLVQLKSELESVDSVWADREGTPYVRRDDGTYVASYGIGHSIISAPVYIVARTAAQVLPGDDRDDFVRVGTFFTNSIVLAAVAVAVALLAYELGRSFNAAMLLAIAYAIGTYALPHAKTYFTELSSALVVTLGVLLAARFARDGRSTKLAAACGFAAGFGVLVRTSTALFVPLFAIFLIVVAARSVDLRHAGRTLLAYCLGGLGPLVAFLFFNAWRYGSPTDLGYPDVPQSYPIIEGLVNNFFSPGKSMFLYAPIVLLGVAGIVVGLYRRNGVVLLMALIIAANLLFYSRVPFWAGDATWGIRYQQMVLPLMVAPAVLLAYRRWFKPAAAGLTVVGALVPALLGSLIYFNVYFLEVGEEGASWGQMTHDVEWQPFLGHLELVPIGIRDVLEANHPDEKMRGPYSPDPSTHYGFYAWEPRIDTWWLWVEPMDSSPVQYVFLLPTAAALGVLLALRTGRLELHGRRLVRIRRERPDPVDHEPDEPPLVGARDGSG